MSFLSFSFSYFDFCLFVCYISLFETYFKFLFFKIFNLMKCFMCWFLFYVCFPCIIIYMFDSHHPRDATLPADSRMVGEIWPGSLNPLWYCSAIYVVHGCRLRRYVISFPGAVILIYQGVHCCTKVCNLLHYGQWYNLRAQDAVQYSHSNTR